MPVSSVICIYIQLPSILYTQICHKVAVWSWGLRPSYLGTLYLGVLTEVSHYFICVGVVFHSRVLPASCLEQVDGRGDQKGYQVQSHPFTDKGVEWTSCPRFLCLSWSRTQRAGRWDWHLDSYKAETKWSFYTIETMGGIVMETRPLLALATAGANEH